MSTIRRLHVSNSQQRNAVVVASSIPTKHGLTMGKNGIQAEFRRYIAAGDGRMNEDLVASLGENYAEQLIQGDPEIDFEVVGQFIEGTQSILISSIGEPLFVAPKIVEISYDADGSETERRDPVDVPATVNDTIPLRWTGRKIPKADAVRKFAFRRSLQLRHVDGVTFDFLFGMAKELADENVLMLLGSGESGKEPLIMQVNSLPYRGFLDGRVNGNEYILLLHLSNMELKKPEIPLDANTEES